MNLQRRFRPPDRGGFLLFTVIVLSVFPALPLHGQEGLATAWGTYAQAAAAYRASVEARDSIREYQEGSIDAIEAARASGQESRLREALADAQAWGANRSGAEATVTRRRADLRTALVDLLSRLRASAAELERLLLGPQGAPTITQGWRDSLRETQQNIARLESELRDLEEEVSPIGIVPVRADPRTSREEYRYRAEVYERRVRNYETLISDTDARIRQLENLSAAQRDQQREALFDPNPTGGRLPPVGGPTAIVDYASQLAAEREKRAIYVAAQDGYREQARIANAFANGQVP